MNAMQHNAAVHKDDSIYVAGHSGLAGSAISRALRDNGYGNLIHKSHAELELTDYAAVHRFFDEKRPRHVVICAARVGGIMANFSFPADFISQNLAIQQNIITAAHRFGAGRLIFLGSSCIYPRDCPQPMKEEYLLSGPLEETNRPYAIAKICGIEMCRSFNRQYRTSYLALMPTNLYGPGDNYDLESSHVLPALLRKFHEAKARGDGHVTLWGSGSPLREFLHSHDLGAAVAFLMGLDAEKFQALCDDPLAPLINVGTGLEITIRDLARKIAAVTGFSGEIRWDSGKPDGTPRKLLDISRMAALGWRARIMLQDGLEMAYQAMLQELRTGTRS